MYSLHFAIIISILMFGQRAVSKEDVINLPVRVFIVPPNNIEFQFEKTDQIDPISLRTANDKFNFFETPSTKNFRASKPLQRADKLVTFTLEYRYTGKQEILSRTFEHDTKDQTNEVIIVRFPIETTPQAETCTSQNCLNLNANSHDAATESTEVAYTLIDKEAIEESCETDDGYTEELLNTALRHGKIETHLLLKGLTNTSANPVDTIRNIIFQKLDLPHLEYNILQAKYTDEGLLFEMKNTKDVIEILRQAKLTFEKEQHGPKIELTTDKILKMKTPLIDIRLAAE